jgi:hypothetical protein
VIRTGAAAALVVFLLLLAALPARAQLAIDNLLELQLGNRPTEPYRDRTDTYDQLDAALAFGLTRAGVRFESDHSSDESAPYGRVTRRWFEFGEPRLRVRAGNYTTILGRGLLHRSWELPGVVLDQSGVRSRYGFLRDVDGLTLDAAAGPVALRGVEGRPNSGEVSPGVEDAYDVPRYAGEMIGGQALVRTWRDATIGAHYLRFTPDGLRHREYGSGSLALDPLGMLKVGGVSLPLYAEYARADATLSNWWDLRAPEGTPSALYASANLLAGPFALSAEWKDYEQFRLGINDPPSLVREHTFVLPNRSTHLVHLEDEEGYQIEGTVRIGGWGSLLGNLSRGDGEVSPSLPPRRFAERYVEADFEPRVDRGGRMALFYDFNEDQFEGVQGRDMVGGRITHDLPHTLTAELDVEHLHERRAPDAFDDEYLSFTLQHARWGSAAFIWQRTTDPAERLDELPRHYLAGVLSAPIGQRHVVTLFAGQRREGIACTAGTCYVVEAFEGVELRITSRF